MSTEQIEFEFYDIDTREGAAQLYREKHSWLGSGQVERCLNRLLTATVAPRKPNATDDKAKLFYDCNEDVDWQYCECPGKPWEDEEPRWMVVTTNSSEYNPIWRYYRRAYLRAELQK